MRRAILAAGGLMLLASPVAAQQMPSMCLSSILAEVICLAAPPVVTAIITNTLSPKLEPPCPFGAPDHTYTFAGKVLTPEGRPVSMAVERLGCAACGQKAAFSANVLDGAAICNDSSDSNWDYSTNCISFGFRVTLAVCAPPVFHCRALGGSGSCANLSNGQKI